MAGLKVSGSVILGPSASSAPSTPGAYLTSLGKSWYGDFRASSNIAPLSDGTGGAVADGGPFGCWATYDALSFTSKWVQSNTSLRPTYGASRDGTPGGYGNGTSAFLALDSTTVLNGPHTVLVSGWIVAESAIIYSHGGLSNTWYRPSATTEAVYVGGTTTLTAPQGWQRGLSGANNRTRMGWTTSGTAHNGTAPILWKYNTSSFYSTSTIFQIILCPALTSAEIRVLLGLMV